MFDRLLEAGAYERVDIVHKASEPTVRAIVNVMRQAKRNMLEDMSKILMSDTMLFKSKEEAIQFLRGKAGRDVLQALMLRAEGMSDPKMRKVWVDKLSNPDIRVKMTRSKAIDESIKMNARESGYRMDKTMRNALIGVSAIAYSHSIFSVQKATSIGFSFTQPDVRTLEALVGKVYNSNLSFMLTDNYGQKFKESFLQGLYEGKSVGDLSKVVNDLIPSSELWQAKRLVRTEITAVSSEGEKQTYKDLNVERYKYLATLDERSCDICGGLDGQVFDVKDASEGENYPPMHPNCRCTTVPYIDESIMADLKRSARDPISGKSKTVSADTTYGQWAKQNADVSRVYEKYVAKQSATP